MSLDGGSQEAGEEGRDFGAGLRQWDAVLIKSWGL